MIEFKTDVKRWMMMTSRLYTISVWIMRIFSLNFLWGLFIIPLLYVSLNLLVGDLEYLQQIFTTLAILAPIFLYPATAALYGVVRKWSMGETDIPILRSFWRYYKENYLISFIGGLIFTVLWVGVSFNFVYLSASNSTIMNIVYIILAVFLFAWNIQYLSFIVHYESKVIHAMKSSFILTAGAPFVSIGILLIHIGVFYATFKFPVLIILCTASISAYVTYLLYYNFMQRLAWMQENKESEDESSTDEDKNENEENDVENIQESEEKNTK